MSVRTRTVALVGSVAALGLMVVALWAWTRALELGAGATRPEVASWAFRSGAVAAGALAQLVLLTCVAHALGRVGPATATGAARPLGSDVLRLSMSIVASVALVSAIALGLAGR